MCLQYIPSSSSAAEKSLIGIQEVWECFCIWVRVGCCVSVSGGGGGCHRLWSNRSQTTTRNRGWGDGGSRCGRAKTWSNASCYLISLRVLSNNLLRWRLVKVVRSHLKISVPFFSLVPSNISRGHVRQWGSEKLASWNIASLKFLDVSCHNN